MARDNPSITERLFERLCDINLLQESFKAVKRNRGAPGIDGQTVDEFAEDLEKELEQLKKELASWTYKPRPVKRVEIPKPNNRKRKLGIPCVRDRVVQAGIKQLLEPLLDPEFSESSYGFRPGRNQQMALDKAKSYVKTGKRYVVDIDLSKFFDRINHDRLISRLGEKIQDKRILRLIGLILRSGVMECGLVTSTPEGAVQGGPLSPLLSNVVLDELDKELEKRELNFCRYADDANIYVGSKKAAARVMKGVCAFIERKLKLKVNWEKSKIATAEKARFLGMSNFAGSLLISQESINRAYDKVKQLTPRGTHETINQTVNRINRWYVGWSNYYSMTNYPSQLKQVEAHIRRRLRARLVRQQKSRRNLYNKLKKRGAPAKYAAIAYSNNKCWALSHKRAVERAYPNSWFESDLGLKIKSSQKLPHWHGVDEWVRLT